MLGQFAADGYVGVLFEITVDLNTDRILQNKLTYDEFFAWMAKPLHDASRIQDFH
jgi:hypothetical protein